MIKWITACFQATMDFLCGKIEDPKPEQKVEDLKKEANEKWVSQQEKKGFTVPSQRMSEKVKTLDNSKSPKTIRQTSSNSLGWYNNHYRSNNHYDGVSEVFIQGTESEPIHETLSSYWSEPERTFSSPSYESLDSSYESSDSSSYDSSSSSYDSFGGGSSDGGGSSSDW